VIGVIPTASASTSFLEQPVNRNNFRRQLRHVNHRSYFTLRLREKLKLKIPSHNTIRVLL
jgi:hypothetical protein